MANDVTELEVLDGTRTGAVFPLPDIPAVLGRSPEAHFKVDDPWISSMHALFERRGETFWVIDLGSRNGTFAGDARVREAPLVEGLTLRFGRTSVRVRGGVRDEATLVPAPASAPGVAHTSSTLTRSLTLPGARSVAPPSPRAPPEVPSLPPQPAALLRLGLHVRPGDPPAAVHVHAALGALSRAVTDRAGLTIRLPGGVLALFGLGGLAPEDARLALAAARAARLAVAALPGGLRLRAALDVGPVLAGNVGGTEDQELAALGEVAERVERLLATAAPGEIAVGADVARVIEGFDPARAVELAGGTLLVCFDRG